MYQKLHYNSLPQISPQQEVFTKAEEVVIGTDHGNKEEYMDVGKVAVSSVFVEGNAQKSILLHKDMISELFMCFDSSNSFSGLQQPGQLSIQKVAIKYMHINHSCALMSNPELNRLLCIPRVSQGREFTQTHSLLQKPSVSIHAQHFQNPLNGPGNITLVLLLEELNSSAKPAVQPAAFICPVKTDEVEWSELEWSE
ncbi:hypothetical protein Anapl_01461 [Anas platyrhynchos]|uniref:Uncharacterized protein n=1 Tax=Anas platyrhynchos TaxID=8839 RepID=R0M6M2_ANAPL|nr:hypothetical protein Anapl_01461 [Anas platyrhynchos]